MISGPTKEKTNVPPSNVLGKEINHRPRARRIRSTLRSSSLLPSAASQAGRNRRSLQQRRRQARGSSELPNSVPLRDAHQPRHRAGGSFVQRVQAMHGDKTCNSPTLSPPREHAGPETATLSLRQKRSAPASSSISATRWAGGPGISPCRRGLRRQDGLDRMEQDRSGQ